MNTDANVLRANIWISKEVELRMITKQTVWGNHCVGSIIRFVSSNSLLEYIRQFIIGLGESP